jgi:hypothetical protein
MHAWTVVGSEPGGVISDRKALAAPSLPNCSIGPLNGRFSALNEKA